MPQRHGGVGHIIGNQAGEAQVVDQIVIGRNRALRQDIHDLGRHGVQGILQGGVDGNHAEVLVAVIGGEPVGALQGESGGIQHGGIRGDEPQVDGRTVGSQRLDGRARGPLGAGGPVQREVPRLFPHAAGEPQNPAVIGIHHNDAALQLLLAAPGIGNGVQIRIDSVNGVLHIHVQAGIHVVAAVIQQGLGRFLADALELHQVIDHIVDDHLGVVGEDVLGDLLAGGAGEHQFLGYRVFILLVVDVALFVHLPQDGLLPFLVVLLVIEGVIIGGQIGDAHNGSALGHGQVLGVLAEIGLGCGLHTVAALAEVHRVEIPFHDLLLVVLLLQLQGAENLRQLALDGYIVLAGQVLDQLLGDGGAAVAGVHFGKHGDKGTGGAVPVHTLVLIKALVLNRNQSLFQIPGQILIIHPHPLALLAGEGGQFPPFAARVLIPQGTGLVQLHVLQGQVKAGGEAGLYIVGEHAGKHHACHQQDQQHGADHFQNAANGAGDHVAGDVCRLFYRLELFPRILFRPLIFGALFAHRNRSASFSNAQGAF